MVAVSRSFFDALARSLLKKAIEARKTQPGMAVSHLLSAVCELVAQAFLPVSAFFSILLADRYGKEPFVIATFAMFTLFPLALAVAHSFPALAVAFAIRGLKESPATARGASVGAYYLIRDSVVTTGSFAGAALWQWGPRINLIAAAGIGVLATLIYTVGLKKIS
jgi:MFS family permease